MGMPESDSNGTPRSPPFSTKGLYVLRSHRSLSVAISGSWSPGSKVLATRRPLSLPGRGLGGGATSPAAPSCRRLREQVAGNDELLDLGGALVDLRDLRVAEVPLHAVLGDEA